MASRCFLRELSNSVLMLVQVRIKPSQWAAKCVLPLIGVSFLWFAIHYSPLAVLCYTSLVARNWFSHTSEAADMLCICNTQTRLHSPALMTWKNEITALIIASTTQSYQAAECSSNYNGKTSAALIQTASNAIRYSHFPQMLVAEHFSSIHFEPSHLSLDEVGAQRRKISMLLCMCGLTLHCVHAWAGCIWGLCLSSVLLPQIELDSYAQYPVTDHNCTDREWEKSIKCFVWGAPPVCANKPFHSHPTYVMRSSN